MAPAFAAADATGNTVEQLISGAGGDVSSDDDDGEDGEGSSAVIAMSGSLAIPGSVLPLAISGSMDM